MNNFVRNNQQNKFYACCYILLSGAHLSAALLCYLFGTISFSYELFSLSKGAAFVHVWSAQLCTENGISIYMCSAVEVAWLAQNSSTRA